MREKKKTLRENRLKEEMELRQSLNVLKETLEGEKNNRKKWLSF